MQEQEAPSPFISMTEGDPEDAPDSVNRVTIRLSMIRERWGEDSQSFPAALGWEEEVSHDSPAFVMPDLKISHHHPQKIDFGWVSSPILVCILNKTRWKGTVNPSEAQRRQIDASLVWIGFDGKTWPLCIGPDASQPLFVTPGADVYVSAVQGTTPTIAIFAT